MPLLKLIAFILGSWLAIVWVFGYSTYHEFFWKNLPLLLGVAVADAWVFVELGFGYRWFTYVIVYVAGVAVIGQQQKRSLTALLSASQDADQAKAVAVSGANTLTYYWWSSILFLIAWFGAYLVFFNRALPT